MALIYRSVWTAAAPGDALHTLRRLQCAVGAWCREDSSLEPIGPDSYRGRVSGDKQRTATERLVVEGGDVFGFEVIVTDVESSEKTTWLTRVQAILEGSKVHVLVENSVESDDLTLRFAVGRPRLVTSLLEVCERPVLGNSAVTSKPLALEGDEVSVLTEVLADPERKLPIIVCTQPDEDHPHWQTSAVRISARTEGIAIVVTLDRTAVAIFRRHLGDLAVWGGAIRVYAPVPVQQGDDGWRHTYHTLQRLDENPQAVLDRVTYAVAQLSTRRRVPGAFQPFFTTVPTAPEVQGSVDLADAALRERDDLELERDLEIEERSLVERDLSYATGHLARLRDSLVRLGQAELYWGTAGAETASIPDEVQNTSEAVLAARAYLDSWLAIPTGADRDLDDIDASPRAYAMGQSTWRGLRALAAYASDRATGWDAGGFWEWCAAGLPLSWPATTKKLAMTESERVQTNPRLREARLFPVDQRISETGTTHMWAHLKISEGGGPLAPRIYFLDDSGGSTRRVHVGFVGPHRLVPNLSTN